MPIYEFRCNKCDNVFEELCSLSNVSSIVCPKCKDNNIERLISLFAMSSGSRSSESSSYGKSSCRSCSATSCKTCSSK